MRNLTASEIAGDYIALRIKEVYSMLQRDEVTNTFQTHTYLEFEDCDYRLLLTDRLCTELYGVLSNRLETWVAKKVVFYKTSFTNKNGTFNMLKVQIPLRDDAGNILKDDSGRDS